ncbi:PREDICTED: histone H2B-like [Condylura cristata]|uniref:histone H2B-like n=1 Tax=Condylura cristata TaxID=143302 RepID=UPI00033462BA|nr:PREDICTED: histone H2B-like [Condylura cristata]XP_004685967.1 PREDICTED: histone H2B-like [Condylura cristata]
MDDPRLETLTEEPSGSGEPAKASPQSQKQKQPTQQKEQQRVLRQRAKNRSDSFATYFPRVLKYIHKDLSLSQKTVSVLDSFVKDMFERIAQESSHLVRSNQRATLTSREIQTAVRLLLPRDLGKLAVREGTQALIRYIHRK